MLVITLTVLFHVLSVQDRILGMNSLKKLVDQKLNVDPLRGDIDGIGLGDKAAAARLGPIESIIEVGVAL